MEFKEFQKLFPDAKIIEVEPNPKMDKEVGEWVRKLNEAYDQTNNSNIRFK